MIRCDISLFIVNSLSFFLPSHLQNNRSSKVASFSTPSFLPGLSGTFPMRVLYFILPVVRSFFVVRIKVFQTKFRKKKRIKIIFLLFLLFSSKDFPNERVFATREQSESVVDQLFFAFFLACAFHSNSKRNAVQQNPQPRHRRCRRWKLPNRRRRCGNRGRRHHFVRLHLIGLALGFVLLRVESTVKARIKRKKEYILYIYSEVREKRKRTRTKIRERERRGKRQKWRKRGRERERESRKFNVKSNAHFSSYFYARIVFFCLCV